ncbi:hypothetical protein HF329_00775 [Chitinophaga oryzae]|uniref:Uncharacterized protein n=1 Tax=Chitinophaga oryzae TaxID=2725414 RepID=A0AAE6ZDK8_9BACT|nr:hypothetical protein [Chitinophaga oryzae]QJB29917.1 hypothetical protein HF329_00775 [Chitinophaga oryzae]
MNQHEKLFALLELFKRKPQDEQRRLAWEMFYSFFRIFPLESAHNMVDDLCAISQADAICCFTEFKKIEALAFCAYLKKSLELLNYEVKDWEKNRNLPPRKNGNT